MIMDDWALGAHGPTILIIIVIIIIIIIITIIIIIVIIVIIIIIIIILGTVLQEPQRKGYGRGLCY